MTAKVSTQGLDFIASWSPFSTTVYKVEVDTVIGDVEYVGYSYYVFMIACATAKALPAAVFSPTA